MSPCKQWCIVDTISLVSLCRLELGSRRVLEWLLDDFDVSIPPKVFNDAASYIRDMRRIDDETQIDDEAQSIFFRRLPQLVHRNTMVSCDYFLSRRIGDLPPEFTRYVHEGERIATALALKLSRSFKQYILLVTDDLKALEPLYIILDRNQIGIVKTSYDMLLFFASRHMIELSPEEIEIALRGLNYLLRDNSKPAHVPQKPDELLDKYLAMISKLSNWNCRTLDCM